MSQSLDRLFGLPIAFYDAPGSGGGSAGGQSDPPAGGGQGGDGGDPNGGQQGGQGSGSGGQTYPAEYVERLRKEAAGYRTELKQFREEQQKRDQALAAALGIKPNPGDGGSPDVQKMLDEIQKRDEERDRKTRTATINAAVAEAMARHHADPDLLRPYLRGLGKLDELDPDADDFAKSVDELVKKSVESNPKLKLGGPTSPPRGGAENNGGGNSNGKTQLTRDDLKGMSPEDIVKAREEGRLVALGYGPSVKR